MDLMTRHKGSLKDSHHSLRVVVGSNAIDGQGFAFDTFMDQHQFASEFTLIFVPALLHGQPNGFHRRLTRRQAVSCHE